QARCPPAFLAAAAHFADTTPAVAIHLDQERVAQEDPGALDESQVDLCAVVLPPRDPGLAALAPRGRFFAERYFRGLLAGEQPQGILCLSRLFERQAGETVDQPRDGLT